MRIASEPSVDRGRRLLLLESVPGRWKSSEPGSRTTAIVDALTYELVETSSRRSTAGTTARRRRHRLLETLDVSRAVVAKLAMKTHAGAKLTRTGR